MPEYGWCGKPVECRPCRFFFKKIIEYCFYDNNNGFVHFLLFVADCLPRGAGPSPTIVSGFCGFTESKRPCRLCHSTRLSSGMGRLSNSQPNLYKSIKVPGSATHSLCGSTTHCGRATLVEWKLALGIVTFH